MKEVVILGIGNPLLSDDGLGVKAVEAIRREFLLPENVSAVDGGVSGLDLVTYLEGLERLLLIDAIRGGGQPGTLYRFTGKEITRYPGSGLSAHDIGFEEVLALLELRGCYPEEVVVLGLEPANLGVGTELSPPVREKLPLLIEESLGQLKLWGVEVRRRKGI